MLKATLKKMPLVRDAVRWLMSKTVAKRQKGFVSRDYWEGRYAKGLDSGAGSYNRLATYKADFLNKFVAENAIERVIEFGSGDGAQLELADYPEYIGIDVSKTAIARTRTKFRSDLKKRSSRRKSMMESRRISRYPSTSFIISLKMMYSRIT